MLPWNTPAPLDQTAFNPADVFAAGLHQHHIANTAYPIAHVTTMRPYRVPRREQQALAPQAWEGLDGIGLYVHIPFCEARCGFCEYTVVDPATRQESESPYFDLLMEEFALWHRAIGPRRLSGFDIGGGTPMIAPVSQLTRVVAAAHRYFDLPPAVEISIETTPKIAAADLQKLRAVRALGIRRISMGIQTVNPHLLQVIGRSVTRLDWNRRAMENIRAAGFEKVNLDLMYGFARQSLASVEATVRHAIDLRPEHITLYRMRYKGTRIAAQSEHVTLEEINREKELLYRLLWEAGYHAPVGKNTFSRLPNDPGTSDYLTQRVIHGTPYLGLGLGAQSLSERTLSYNAGAADKRLRNYQRKIAAGKLPLQDLYHLSLPAAMGKFISVSFYFGGISRPDFERKFGQPLEAAFPAEVAFVLENGLMEVDEDSLRLTADGAKQYNGVIALFYAGAVKAVLLEMAAQPALSHRRQVQAVGV